MKGNFWWLCYGCEKFKQPPLIKFQNWMKNNLFIFDTKIKTILKVVFEKNGETSKNTKQKCTSSRSI